jgi:hypothetical protein
MYLVDQSPNSTFTAAELARLTVYRAAVAAGFYTDWDGSETAPAPADETVAPADKTLEDSAD